MKKYLLKTVLVPLDFSEMSLSALEAALEISDSPSRIEVVHVTSYPSPMEPGIVWGTMTEDTMKEKLNEYFATYARQAGLPDLKFTALFGDPGSRIAEFAKERDAGLIVISSHGRTGVNRLLLGSVTERVVRLAPCPVLVLRDEKES